MPTRVLVAKPGLDGHDRGAKIIARALRDAGFEVIYTGLRQSPKVIASVAVQEDVAAVGLSILSGAHVPLTRRTIEALREVGAADIKVVVGGAIPRSDVPVLLDLGVDAVYPTGSQIDLLVADLRRLTRSSRAVNNSPLGSLAAAFPETGTEVPIIGVARTEMAAEGLSRHQRTDDTARS
jgi:methylmalonyl-CoA mutase C-terminal domain/subunit